MVPDHLIDQLSPVPVLAVAAAAAGYFLNKKSVNIAFLSIGVDYFQVLALFAASKVAWPAFVVAVLTGVWNLMAVDITTASSAYQATALLKIAVAIASGVFAAVHSFGRTKLALALGGALGALSAILAMFLGVLLHAHG